VACGEKGDGVYREGEMKYFIDEFMDGYGNKKYQVRCVCKREWDRNLRLKYRIKKYLNPEIEYLEHFTRYKNGREESFVHRTGYRHDVGYYCLENAIGIVEMAKIEDKKNALDDLDKKIKNELETYKKYRSIRCKRA
jgi:hypothetical protein